jgi:hypothetical protein
MDPAGVAEDAVRIEPVSRHFSLHQGKIEGKFRETTRSAF